MPEWIIGVVGAGSMGSGIAQVAAQAGHTVVLSDSSPDALERAAKGHQRVLFRLAEKGNISEAEAKATAKRLTYTRLLDDLKPCHLVIEAIIEDLAIKQGLFQELEIICGEEAVLATNTSSLPVGAIGGKLQRPERCIGLHFFNPAPLMPLVEVIPGMMTDSRIAQDMFALMNAWGKVPVFAKDTPGFIVNRVARPFYSEALRILEEGMADCATIDHAIRTVGGFRMGPFELMDLIGNDVNFAVTCSVHEAFFYDSRYRPSVTQQRMVEAGLLGRKSGRGYYSYTDGAEIPKATTDPQLAQRILDRILCNLINHAVEAVHLSIASPTDIDLAMTKGVNYPKGLLRWGNELGLDVVLRQVDAMYEEYREERYRPSVLLRRMAHDGVQFQLG